MGLKDFLIGFFEESPEEIKEDIKYLDTQINDIKKLVKNPKKSSLLKKNSELKKELNELIKNKKFLQKKLKNTKVKKRINYTLPIYILISVCILIGLIYLYIGYSTTHCMELRKNNIGCIKISEPNKSNEHKISFYYKNSNNFESVCRVTSTIMINNVKISEKIHNLGLFKADEAKEETIIVNLIEGESDFFLKGECISS